MYRGQEEKVIYCYSDSEAAQKARTWYQRYCTDPNKHISNLAIKTPSGQVKKV